MAYLKHAMEALEKLEYSRPSNVLHHLNGESGYTYYGIYETAHPRWVGWSQVYAGIKKYKYNLPHASRMLFRNEILKGKVYGFYRHEYWEPMKLELIVSQKIAEELFIFAVNTNPKRAIKKAQKIVGVKVDGWIGHKTLKALNTYNEKSFDIKFDLAEIAYYRYLSFFSKRKKHFRQFYDGWVKRAVAV